MTARRRRDRRSPVTRAAGRAAGRDRPLNRDAGARRDALRPDAWTSATSDRRWDDGNLDQLKRIPGKAFEVVQSAARVHAC